VIKYAPPLLLLALAILIVRVCISIVTRRYRRRRHAPPPLVLPLYSRHARLRAAARAAKAAEAVQAARAAEDAASQSRDGRDAPSDSSPVPATRESPNGVASSAPLEAVVALPVGAEPESLVAARQSNRQRSRARSVPDSEARAGD
jgi:hypothetical protein